MFESIKFILIGIVVAMLVYAFIKFKGLRLFLGTAICVVIVLTGVFSAFRINNYYNSSGGIVGQIVGSYKQNEIAQDEMKFEIKNTTFSKSENGEKYSIKIQTANTYSLNENEYYTVFVNDEACRVIYSSKDSVTATYTYCFKSSDFENGDYTELATDTMTISFAFYQNYGELFIEIDNGEETKALWESFFEKNNFIIEIKKVDEIKLVNSSLKSVKIVADNEIVKTIYLKSGTTFVLPQELEIDGFKFNYFEIDGEKIVYKIVVNKDTIINANLSKVYEVFAFLNAPDERTPYLLASLKVAENENIELDSPAYEDFEFLGWSTSTNKEDIIDLNSFKVESATKLYAIWNTSNRQIDIEFNESDASIDFNETTITGNQTVYVDYFEKLQFSNPQKENFKLSYFEICGKFEKMTYSAGELDELQSYDFYYKNLNSSSEYLEDNDNSKIIKIKFYFVSTIDEILTMENKIYNVCGIKNITEREDESTFLKCVYQSLTRDDSTFANLEYRQKLAELFEFENDESWNFEDFLKSWVSVLYTYKVNLIIGEEKTTKSVIGKNQFSLNIPTKEGYFTFAKIEGMSKLHSKFYSIDYATNFIEIASEETSTTIYLENSVLFLKNLADDGGEITVTVTYEARTYNIEYDLNGGSGDVSQTSIEYDKTFTISAPVKVGYIFTGWTITNMDHCTHIYGDQTTTESTINLTQATEFKNLNATSGTIKFTANWEVDPNYRGGR